MSLTRRQRARRVAILSCHYLSNCAYYYAGRDGKNLKRDDQFSRRVNGNFMDLCTLEFCKLFAEKRGAHHWRKVITDQAKFFAGLLKAVGMSAAEWDEYVDSIKFYRDKYVAHLDDETGGNYPHLGPGKKAASYLFDYLLEHENEGDFFPDAQGTAAAFYRDREDEGDAAYE